MASTAQRKIWAAKNPEKIKAYRKTFDQRHPGRRKTYAKTWLLQREGETALEWRKRTFSRKSNRKNRLQATDIEWPTHCPVLGFELDYTGKDHYCGWSIDKIIPSRGYVAGNVAIISKLANRIKQDATSEQILQVANWVASKTAL